MIRMLVLHELVLKWVINLVEGARLCDSREAPSSSALTVSSYYVSLSVSYSNGTLEFLQS